MVFDGGSLDSAFTAEALAFSVVVYLAASAHLVWRLRLSALVLILGLPAAVLAGTIVWLVLTPPNHTGMFAPGLGVLIFGWLALLAVPYVLAAIGLVVETKRLLFPRREPRRPPPLTASPYWLQAAPPPPAPPPEPILETVLVRARDGGPGPGGRDA